VFASSPRRAGSPGLRALAPAVAPESPNGAAGGGRSGGSSDAAGPSSNVTLRLDPDVDAAGKAREALAPLREALDERVLQDVQLLVTELVTNSVRHADAAPGDPVRLEVSVTGDRVFVAVEDLGSGFSPQPRDEGSPRDSGWGLHLVDQVSARWGVNGERSTRVWLELDRRVSHREP
jgi:serine/threonine-protein kinase RsbW